MIYNKAYNQLKKNMKIKSTRYNVTILDKCQKHLQNFKMRKEYMSPLT